MKYRDTANHMNNIVTIVQYMAVELIFGVLVGIISKEVIKSNAKNSSNMQVFSSSEYRSIAYENNFPKLNFFNIFNLKPKLIIVHYDKDQVTREDFYTILGDRTTAIYQNGSFNNSYWEIWGLPIYICTAVIPLLIGFFLGIVFSFVPSLNAFFTYLFVSGFIWGSIVGLLYPLLYKESE